MLPSETRQRRSTTSLIEHPDAGNDPQLLRLRLHALDHPGLVQRHAAAPGPTALPAVSQTFEVLIDDYSPANGATQLLGGQRRPATFRVTVQPRPTRQIPNAQTVLNNPTLGCTLDIQPTRPRAVTGDQPGQLAATWPATSATLAAAANASATAYPFTLDGRWLHAFNGPGIGTQRTPPRPATTRTLTSVPCIDLRQLPLQRPEPQHRRHGRGLRRLRPGELVPGDPERRRPGDDPVVPPAGHHPLRPDQHGRLRNDWHASNFDGPNSRIDFSDSAVADPPPGAADGHDPATFPDLIPDPTTGKITYDVDNDGDGVTDSVWLDLGYPARRDSSGKLYKPLFAFMVIGLNGRIPLNTAGNLAGTGATHAQHLGNSVSEIDPTYALQNAYHGPTSTPVAGDLDPFNQLGMIRSATSPWQRARLSGSTTDTTYNTQVDNAIVRLLTRHGTLSSVDVRLTQLRNLLAGTRPQSTRRRPTLTIRRHINGDANLVWGSGRGTARAALFPAQRHRGRRAIPCDLHHRSQRRQPAPTSSGRRRRSAGGGARPRPSPGVPSPTPTAVLPLNLVQSNYANPAAPVFLRHHRHDQLPRNGAAYD